MKFTSLQVSPTKFFILAFALSWLIWIPLVLSHFGIAFNIPDSTSNMVRLLGVLMPAVSALTLTRFMGGREAIRDLWERLFLWRVGLGFRQDVFQQYPCHGWMNVHLTTQNGAHGGVLQASFPKRSEVPHACGRERLSVLEP